MESKMRRAEIILVYSLFIMVAVATSCEEEFTPITNFSPPDIVVEGYIEGGDNATSPYVILTRSIPFFSELDLNAVDSFFVHDADIIVSTSGDTVFLEEFCLSELSDAQREIIAQSFNIGVDTAGLDFCVYLDPTFSLSGEESKTYELEIKVDDKLINASTLVPKKSKISNYTFFDIPGVPNDSLRELRVTLEDPPNEANFYRYFTSINEAGMLAPTQSVVNDLFFDGDQFVLPLAKAESADVQFNLDTYGYYRVGDTVDIKFCTIDEGHYDFWSTLEFNKANQGPFSSYTAISYNTNGAIGIWGGYSCSIQRLIVE